MNQTDAHPPGPVSRDDRPMHWPERTVGIVIGAALAVVMVLTTAYQIVGLTAGTHRRQTTLRYGSVRSVIVEDASTLRLRAGTAGAGVTVERTVVESMLPVRARSSVAGSTLTLSGRCDGWQLIGRCEISYDVAVAPDTSIVARGHSGSIQADGLTGRVSLTTDSGDVTATGITGPVALRADSGDVTVRGQRGGTVSLRTDSGDVTATGVRTADLTASANSGNVDVSFDSAPMRVKARADSGDVTIEVPRGSATYRVQRSTDSGTTSSTVPDSGTADRTIEAQTGSGDVTVRYPQ